MDLTWASFFSISSHSSAKLLSIPCWFKFQHNEKLEQGLYTPQLPPAILLLYTENWQPGTGNLCQHGCTETIFQCSSMVVLKLDSNAPEKYRTFYFHTLIMLNSCTDLSTIVLQISSLQEEDARLRGYRSSQWQLLPEFAHSWMQLPAPGIVSRSVEKPDDIWKSSKTKKNQIFQKKISFMDDEGNVKAFRRTWHCWSAVSFCFPSFPTPIGC